MMLAHHGALDKLKLFHLEDGGFNHQRDYKISLIGFGNFSVSKVAARDGRNPQAGATIKIPAYNQVRFKVGQKMKDAVN